MEVKSLMNLCKRKAISTKTYWNFKFLLKRKTSAIQYERKPFQLNGFLDTECLAFFRFPKNDIKTLTAALKVPKIIILKNRIKFKGIHIDKGSLSRIFIFMLTWIYNHYGKCLHSLQQNYISPSLLEELAYNAFNRGSPYPNIVGFIDGTYRRACRPSKNQREYYSGYKRQHVVKYQSVMLTNGLMGRLDGPYIGRRHDAAILYLSKILDEMSNVFECNGTQYAVYGDRATRTNDTSKWDTKTIQN
ncbi:hypothetical protein Bhyg_03161 [Pseudolycoriella hygida]|uniref:DDE Tnp4 domain-containing protein n=1 Tax=Pseudolycoriella hygida TaxID=35572 RepID=A0A9Q0NCT0_9DIPT|nr:hypothetical protein Bhyg_03161 [Pseudolycoriella hygida]